MFHGVCRRNSLGWENPVTGGKNCRKTFGIMFRIVRRQKFPPQRGLTKTLQWTFRGLGGATLPGRRVWRGGWGVLGGLFGNTKKKNPQRKKGEGGGLGTVQGLHFQIRKWEGLFAGSKGEKL